MNTGGDILKKKKEKREKRFFNINHGLINDHRLHGLIGLPFQQRIKTDYTNYNNDHRLRGLTGLFQTTD